MWNVNKNTILCAESLVRRYRVHIAQQDESKARESAKRRNASGLYSPRTWLCVCASRIFRKQQHIKCKHVYIMTDCIEWPSQTVWRAVRCGTEWRCCRRRRRCCCYNTRICYYATLNIILWYATIMLDVYSVRCVLVALERRKYTNETHTLNASFRLNARATVTRKFSLHSYNQTERAPPQAFAIATNKYFTSRSFYNNDAYFLFHHTESIWIGTLIESQSIQLVFLKSKLKVAQKCSIWFVRIVIIERKHRTIYKQKMSASPIARSLCSTNVQSIPSKKLLVTDPSQMPDVYSSTPNGTLYSTTPGGEFHILILFFFLLSFVNDRKMFISI